MNDKINRLRELRQAIVSCRNNDLLLSLMDEQVNIILDRSFVWDEEGVRAAESALAVLPALEKLNEKYLETWYVQGMAIQNKYQRIKAKVKAYYRLSKNPNA